MVLGLSQSVSKVSPSQSWWSRPPVLIFYSACLCTPECAPVLLAWLRAKKLLSALLEFAYFQCSSSSLEGSLHRKWIKGPRKICQCLSLLLVWMTQASQGDPEFGGCIFKCQKGLVMEVHNKMTVINFLFFFIKWELWPCYLTTVILSVRTTLYVN